MTPLERVSADVGAERVVEVLRRDGGVVVEGMFDRDTVDSVRASADGYATSVEPGSATQGLGEDGRSFVGQKTVRFSSLAKLCPAFFDVLDNDLLAAVADEVLLPVCGGYWLNTAQVMYIGPGEVAQVLHRDANNWWEFVRRTWPDAPEITVSAMIGLDDVTEELGATRVVPRTHLGGELARYGDGESVPAELSPGDALLYSGYVLHGGGANTTESRWRKAMHVSFVAGWLTPEEASPLDFAPGELADRSERIRQLLGHASYDPRPHPGGGLWLRHAKEMTTDATRAELP